MFIIKIKRADLNKIIKLNGLKEVTSLTMMDKGVPAKGGLFDYEIFGHSQSERKAIPAYIDLKGKYLHPLVYYNLRTLNRKLESLILGTKYFKLTDDGELIEDPKGDTGLDFLYKIWDKIKFKETQSIFANEKIKNLKDRDRAFVDKWIVIPAFYRDINMNTEGRPSYDEINEDYISIIRMVASVSQQEQYGFVSNMTKSRIQLTLNKIHDTIVDTQVRAKKGVFKRFVMGKNIDFSARLVISAPQITGERHTDMQVRFNRMGVPLATVCSIFFPFVVYGVREFFHNEFVHGGKYGYYDKDGNLKYTTLINPEMHFSDEYIIKMIKRFIFGPTTRFETIDIPPNEDNVKLKMRIEGRFGKERTSITRPLTWTDILYMVCEDTLSDKYIYATRYPIEDSFGINPAKMSILTTTETVPALIGDKFYKFYPKVEPDKPSNTAFMDTLIVGNAYLPGYGGDYDGDMLSVFGVYTNEANEDAERHTKDKKNIISLTTDNMRIAQRDFVQTFYALTKHPNVEGLPKFKNLSRTASF